MFGSIASGTTEIHNFLEGADCLATIRCFRTLGIDIEEKGSSGLFFCRSFFPKEKKDYTVGQPQFTLLFKEKITVR